MRSITITLLLCLTISVASARTWRDPKYGGVYEFQENGVLTIKHPTRQFTGKWWSVDQSSVKFQLHDDNGRSQGVNTLEMRTHDTAVVKMAGLANSFRWKLVESRGGAARVVDPAESGWFMEALRF